MPLSEQEQRLLDEMERNLYQNDADFVATVGARNGRTNYRGIVLGAVLVVVGIATLLVGVGMRQPIIGVVGFVVMFGGVIVALSPARGSTLEASTTPPASSPGSGDKARRGGFMNSLNDRWERRQDGNGS